MFGAIRARVSASPLTHVVIAAFIGGVLPVLYPALHGGDLTAPVIKMALYAGLSAVLRAVVLVIPPR